MPRVLCVHPDEFALERLRRALMDQRRSWDVEVVRAAEPALERLRVGGLDAIVAAQASGLDALALLTTCRDEAPEVVRILLAGHGVDDAQLRALRIVHRCVPIDGPDPLFVETLARALAMSSIVGDPRLRQVLGRLGQLPVAPRVYAELSRRIHDPTASIVELGEHVAQDPALSVQVLRIANSAYFGRDRQVTWLPEAAARLGTRLLLSVVLAAEVLERFPLPPDTFSLDSFQKHSTLVARLASSLEPRATWADDAFTGGLLHDVGKLVIASRMPMVWTEILDRSLQGGRPVHVVERDVLGVDHAALGACLLGTWGLPSAVIESVLRHHAFDLEGDLRLDAASAVALADRLAHEADNPERMPTAATPELVSQGDPRWPWWREMAGQMHAEAPAA